MKSSQRTDLGQTRWRRSSGALSGLKQRNKDYEGWKTEGKEEGLGLERGGGHDETEVRQRRIAKCSAFASEALSAGPVSGKAVLT